MTAAVTREMIQAKNFFMLLSLDRQVGNDVSFLADKILRRTEQFSSA